jgi:hypothetical protein
MMDHPLDLSHQPAWQSHLRTLREQFQGTSGGKCLLWVNPAQHDPFEDDVLPPDRKVRVRITHPRFDQKFGPYLVHLDLAIPEDADLFASSVKLAWDSWTLDSLLAFRGQPIAGWIVTNETAELLAHYWATCSHLHVHDRLIKLLRFHDPGVREWLWPTLSTTQQHQLLGPATTLTAIDRQHQLMVHGRHAPSPPRSGNDAAAPATSVKRLALTSAQWQQVEDYSAVHGGWLAWRRDQVERDGTTVQRSGWQADIFDALLHAREYGVDDVRDRELFVTHALQSGPQFHLRPEMQHVWNRTRAGEFYGSAFDEVSGRSANI